jgi:hypothetical protein
MGFAFGNGEALRRCMHPFSLPNDNHSHMMKALDSNGTHLHLGWDLVE